MQVDENEIKGGREVVDEATAATPPVEAEATEAVETAAPQDALLVAVQKYIPETTMNNRDENAVLALNKMGAMEDKLKAACKKYPELAQWFYLILEKKMSPDEATARTWDRSLLNPPEGSPDWDRISKADAERMKEVEAREARISTLKKNGEVTLDNASKFIEETGLDEEKAMGFLEYVDKLRLDMQDENITLEHFAGLYKGYIHDEAMKAKDGEKENEISVAEARGRNQQIAEKHMKAENADGIPNIISTGKKGGGKQSFGSKFFEGVV